MKQPKAHGMHCELFLAGGAPNRSSTLFGTNHDSPGHPEQVSAFAGRQPPTPTGFRGGCECSGALRLQDLIQNFIDPTQEPNGEKCPLV